MARAASTTEALQERTAMGCEEKARLVEEHQRAALAYSRAAVAVNRNKNAQLRETVEETRLKSQAARLAVERHVAEHGC